MVAASGSARATPSTKQGSHWHLLIYGLKAALPSFIPSFLPFALSSHASCSCTCLKSLRSATILPLLRHYLFTLPVTSITLKDPVSVSFCTASISFGQLPPHLNLMYASILRSLGGGLGARW